jgi:YVTN family beta-propeller protein
MATDVEEIVYVENSKGGDVSVVEVPSFELRASIEVGHHPDDILAAPDGDMLYLNRQDTRDLVAVDPGRGEIVWRAPLSGLPHHLAFSADGGRIFAAIFNEPVLDVVDLEAKRVVARADVGFGGHGVFLSPDGERVYVGSLVQDHIAVVDATTYETLRFIPFPEAVRPFAITPDERLLYVQLSKRHGFLVVDLASERVVEEVALPPLTPDVEFPRWFPHTVDHGLRFSPDGQRLFVCATTGGYVAVFSLPEHELVTTIAVGREPGWLTFGPDGSRCYVTNRAENTLSVISVDDLIEVARVPVGDYPQRMVAVEA